MKFHLSSLAIFVAGLVITLSSWIRWFIIYPDESQGLFGIAIGLIIMFVAYHFNYSRIMKDEIEHTNNKIDAVEQWIEDRK